MRDMKVKISGDFLLCINNLIIRKRSRKSDEDAKISASHIYFPVLVENSFAVNIKMYYIKMVDFTQPTGLAHILPRLHYFS